MKKYLVLGICLVLYLIISILIASNSGYNNNNMIVSSNAIFHYSNKKWVILSKDKLSKINYKKYNVFDANNNLLGKYDLKYTDDWKIIKNNKLVENDSKIFAYKMNKKISIIDFQLEYPNEQDKNIITQFLKDNNLSSYKSLDTINKIVIDYDNDGIDEYIYIISSMYSEMNLNKYFSIIFTYNDEIYDILEEVEILDDNLSQKSDSIVYKIIDINQDGKYEIITENMKFGRPDNCTYSLYQLKNDKYNLVVTNR